MDEKVRTFLRQKEIKLWLPPYILENGEAVIPEDLILQCMKFCGCENRQEIECCLKTLQSKSTDKFNANEKYKTTGLARIAVSVVDPEAPGDQRNAHVETFLDSTGGQLKDIISDSLDIDKSGFRVIAMGRNLEQNIVLKDQGLKHGSEILCLVLSKDERRYQEQLGWAKNVDATLEAARRLALKNLESETGDEMFEIRNQKGEILNIPDEERRALMVALSLHEKGTQAIRERKYGQAILFLLEADREFCSCRSEILESSDNYAILCLDVAWCYLCLQSVDKLPDAESKLTLCESGFDRSYGPNLERLANIKKCVDAEKALLIRLKLLKGILAFHKDQRALARTLLSEVEARIQEMKVEDDKLAMLMNMGYTDAEARLGLRSSQNNLEMAVNCIAERREDLENQAKQIRNEKKQKKYGRTANGEWVSLEKLEQLQEFGCEKQLSIEALRTQNNDLNKAIEYVSLFQTGQSSSADDEYPEEFVNQIVAMGFSREKAIDSLHQCDGLIQSAIDHLVKEGNVTSNEHDDTSEDQQPAPKDQHSSHQSTSVHTEHYSEQDISDINELRKNVPESELEYLNISFDEEIQFLEKYKLLLIVNA